MKKKNTRELTDTRKRELSKKHSSLIMMIHTYGSMMLKAQIIQLYHILYGTNQRVVEMSIKELIENGFLLQKRISFNSNTQILYLSKYARMSFYEHEQSGNVPAIKFSERKIYESILKVDYIIYTIIPHMQEHGYEISITSILHYLRFNGSNLFLSSNQIDNYNIYLRMRYALKEKGFTLNEDFVRDSLAYGIDYGNFIHNSHEPNYPREDMEDTKALYTNKVEQSKYCYNLVNMHAHRFFVTNIEEDEIQLVYFDSLDSIDITNYYTQLSYIYHMFCRYLDCRDLKLTCTLYTWSMERKEELEQEEQKNYFDRLTQEFSDETKKEHILRSIGILPSKWENIQSTYQINDLTKKYNVSIGQ